MGLTGTHQNLVGLTIFKSGESRDSPFQNPSENPEYLHDSGIVHQNVTAVCSTWYGLAHTLVDDLRSKIIRPAWRTEPMAALQPCHFLKVQ